METAFPALLSGVADTLLRRPPSLRELIVIVGYADDYAWFAELVHRIFPQEAGEVLSVPGVRARVERFADLFAERHFPLYAPFVEYWAEVEGDEPPWSWLRRGIPFDLAGFGYDTLHELWDCCSEGLAALALLVKPPEGLYGTDEIRTAWLESAAERIPKETLQKIPRGGIAHRRPEGSGEGDSFRRGGPGLLLGLRRDRQLLPGPQLRRRMVRRLRRPLGRGDHRRGDGGVAQGPRPHGIGQSYSSIGWRRTSPAASTRCWTSSCQGCPHTNTRRKTMTSDADRTEWSVPGAADAPKDALKMQLEVYGETILLRGFEREVDWVRTVSADEIANVFTQHLGFSSGLLPENALWWGQGETGRIVGLWRPPQVWPVALQREAFEPPARLRLPMPGLVFVCSPGRAPWVYASMRRPLDPEQMLYRTPAFNVFRDGRVCPGSHKFPDDAAEIPESFFRSYFSLTGDSNDRSKMHPDNLQALWEEIDGETEYPTEDLVPQCTVAEAIALSEGRRGRRW